MWTIRGIVRVSAHGRRGKKLPRRVSTDPRDRLKLSDNAAGFRSIDARMRWRAGRTDGSHGHADGFAERVAESADRGAHGSGSSHRAQDGPALPRLGGP